MVELVVGDVVEQTDWVLVSDDSLMRFPRLRPGLVAGESDCSGMAKVCGGSCFGERCLFNSTALPTAENHRTTFTNTDISQTYDHGWCCRSILVCLRPCSDCQAKI